MSRTHSFKQGLAKVLRRWKKEDYDAALRDLEELRQRWPGSAHLEILWATIVQLQENPSDSLADVKLALERAIELDQDSPAGPIELGHFLDAVEDDPRAAAKAFAEGVSSARRLLIDGLLGQARASLQLNRKQDALACLAEALYLANVGDSSKTSRTADAAPDVLLRDPAGWLQFLQVKGPFAIRIEDLLEEVSRRRSA